MASPISSPWTSQAKKPCHLLRYVVNRNGCTVRNIPTSMVEIIVHPIRMATVVMIGPREWLASVEKKKGHLSTKGKSS